MAGLARLSPYHFARAFKLSFGIPPHRYHAMWRIDEAKALLANPDFSITHIGLRLGFGQTSAFTTSFRKLTGAGTAAFAPAFGTGGSVIAAAGTLSFTGGFTQTGGSTSLSGGNLASSSTMLFNAGSLNGSGTVSAPVSNAGTLAPGTPTTPGTINITGGYSHLAAATLAIRMAGTAAGQFDQVNVTGAPVTIAACPSSSMFVSFDSGKQTRERPASSSGLAGFYEFRQD